MGVKSISDLKKKIKSGKIEVNSKIKLGLKYHGFIKTNIPRKEIDTLFEVLKKIIAKMNKKNKLNEKNEYLIEICGSYRREKLTSNDVDVLITKKGNDKTDYSFNHHFFNLVNQNSIISSIIVSKE